MTVENLHELRSTITAAMKELEDNFKSSKKKKSSTAKVSLQDKKSRCLYKKMQQVEMPILEEGNMKHFHDSFMKYYPMLLMFKEKY
jgi:hypothetical protein